MTLIQLPAWGKILVCKDASVPAEITKKLPSSTEKGTEKQSHLLLSPSALKSHSWNQWDWKEESKTKSQKKNGVRKGKKVREEKANCRLSTDSW